MTVPMGTANEIKGKIAEKLFEVNYISKFHMINTAPLVLASRGVTTGTVVDLGAGITQIVPVIEGKVKHKGMVEGTFTGRHIDIMLKKLLFEAYKDQVVKTKAMQSTRGNFFVKEVKEELCYVTNDRIEDDELSKTKPNEISEKHELPDGQIIEVVS